MVERQRQVRGRRDRSPTRSGCIRPLREVLPGPTRRSNPARARVVWIRARLAGGTGLDSLLGAAGLTHPRILRVWTGWLPSLTGRERSAVLRNT